MLGRDIIAKLEETQTDKLLNMIGNQSQTDTIQGVNIGSQTDTLRGVTNGSQTDTLGRVTNGLQTNITLSCTLAATSTVDTQTDQLVLQSSFTQTNLLAHQPVPRENRHVQTNLLNCVNRKSQTVTPSVTNCSQTNSMTYCKCTQTKHCITFKTTETQTTSDVNFKTVWPKVAANISTQTTSMNIEGA